MLRSSENHQLASFYENMNSFSLIAAILQPTRFNDNSCSLIDNIFVSKLNYFKSGLLTADISDHLPVFIVYKNYYTTNVVTTEKISFRFELSMIIPWVIFMLI